MGDPTPNGDADEVPHEVLFAMSQAASQTRSRNAASEAKARHTEKATVEAVVRTAIDNHNRKVPGEAVSPLPPEPAPAAPEPAPAAPEPVPATQAKAPDDPNTIALDPATFERLLRLEAELKNALLVRHNSDLQWQAVNLQRLEQMRQADAAVAEAEKSKLEAAKVVESQYSIKLQEWTYHREAGTLVRAPK